MMTSLHMTIVISLHITFCTKCWIVIQEKYDLMVIFWKSSALFLKTDICLGRFFKLGITSLPSNHLLVDLYRNISVFRYDVGGPLMYVLDILMLYVIYVGSDDLFGMHIKCVCPIPLYKPCILALI